LPWATASWIQRSAAAKQMQKRRQLIHQQLLEMMAVGIQQQL
jgi:hypothetical protein